MVGNSVYSVYSVGVGVGVGLAVAVAVAIIVAVAVGVEVGALVGGLKGRVIPSPGRGAKLDFSGLMFGSGLESFMLRMLKKYLAPFARPSTRADEPSIIILKTPYGNTLRSMSSAASVVEAIWTW